MSTPPHAIPARRPVPRPVAIALWALVLVVAAALVTILRAGGERMGAPLDPVNPAPPGAQAVARVAQERGVELAVVRSQAALLAQSVDSDTTLLVTGAEGLSGRTASTALAHASDAARVILVEPPPAILRGLRLPVTASQDPTDQVRAQCSLDEVDRDEQISEGAVAYQPDSGARGVTICFPGAKGGYYASLAPTQERPAVSLLGSGRIITNGLVTDADNAALALRLLGGTDRLVWYVPDSADIEAGDPTSVEALVPPAVGPALLLGASAVVALCLWRGRRLGRLVGEPLPVVVRAVETTQSRGRMYRKSRDRRRALAILQAATRSRLAAYLGLPSGTDVAAVAAAAAAVSGRTYQDVLALLQSATVDDDAMLVALAGQLAALEKEVRRP